MKPLTCQRGTVIPVIIIVAAFVIGVIGPIAYPQIQLQFEKLTNTASLTKQVIESEGLTASQSASGKNLTTGEELPGTLPAPSVSTGTKTKIATESEKKAEPEPVINKAAVEDEEGKAAETGKKDEAEQGQSEEGVDNNPPVNLNFRVLDFDILPNPTLVPIPSLKPFISSYIGKIKLFTIASSSPTPTPTPQPVPASKKAIVITLDSVKIHDDMDPALNGEAQIVSSVRTGFKEQVAAWPYKNWDETNDGDTLKIKQPIFVLPKDQMDEKLAFWITVSENDSLPSSATGLIEKAYDISSGSKLIHDNPVRYLQERIYDETIGGFLGWLGEEEHIGTYAHVLSRSDNYGMGNGTKKTFTQRKGDATFTYTIRELTIPDKPLRVEMTLKKIKSGENGDYDYAGGDGDLYVWSFVSDGFRDKEMNSLTKRIPSSGLHDIEDNKDWNVNEQIISATISGPIFYYEIGVWDEDDTGNDDQLEIVSDTLFMTNYRAGDVLTISDDGDDGVDASGTIEREIRFFEVN